MASYRPFHPPPPPPSAFPPAQPPPPNQNPPPPPPPAHGGNQYSQNWGPYGSSETSNYSQNYSQGNPGSNFHRQNLSLPPRNPFPPQNQQQFHYQPPPPPDAAYPPPPPPPAAPSAAPAYFPVSSQYPNFGQPPQVQPPPPPPPPSPPPPPPPSHPSPPPPQVPSQPSSGVTKDSKLDSGAYHKTDVKPPLPTSGKRSSGEITDRVETEEERRVRKKREYDKQKQDEKMKLHLKELQNKALQKTQVVASGVKGHGSISGSHMGDRRNIPLMSSDRAENRLKKPTTFLCKMKFRNELPDPSAKMKLLSLKRDPDRYIALRLNH